MALSKSQPAKKSTLTKSAPAIKPLKLKGRGQTLSSKTVYEGKVFWVTRDEVAEPGGVKATRDVIRHNGSVVVLAVDTESNPKDPGILLIRQYRHAAGKILLELPAGRMEPGEKPVPAAKRELIEETGYRAKRWSKHATYYASPGFLTETMTILLAEGLTLGHAAPEEDEKIELHMTPLSEVLRMIHSGKIEDGKTLIGVLLYDSLHHSRSIQRPRLQINIAPVNEFFDVAKEPAFIGTLADINADFSPFFAFIDNFYRLPSDATPRPIRTVLPATRKAISRVR